jgi:hypothetical protein
MLAMSTQTGPLMINYRLMPPTRRKPLGEYGFVQSSNPNLSITEDRQGADDVQGALNHITNATILAAGDEIKLGRAINLK